jgi:phage recombination protein Bet
MTSTALATAEDKNLIAYIPMGEKTAIELTIPRVRKYLAAKTRSGKTAGDEDVIKFMMLCKARQLNPWVGDAFLVGYDSSDGATFSLITSIQALYKRAENSPDFDGLESGIVIESQKGGMESLDIEGAILPKGSVLVGGWAKAHRKDLKVPFSVHVQLAVFNSNRSRWKIDPAGMITKVAEAAALRKAFPSQMGGMLVEGEMDTVEGQVVRHKGPRVQNLDELTDALSGAQQANPQQTVIKQVPAEPDPAPEPPAEPVEPPEAVIPPPEPPASKPAPKKRKKAKEGKVLSPVLLRYKDSLDHAKEQRECEFICEDWCGDPNMTDAECVTMKELRDARIAEIEEKA